MRYGWYGCVVFAMMVCLFGFDPVLGADEPQVGEVPVESEPVQPENQWEKFKAGARQAGQAVAGGTKNTMGKVADGAHRAGDAVVEGSKKAGHAIAEGYEEAKEYVQEKID